MTASSLEKISIGEGKMVRKTALIRILAVLIISCISSNAFGFSLLSNDETLSVSLTGQPVYSVALARDLEIPKNPGPPSSQAEPNKTYVVESVFSLEFPKVLIRDTGHVLTSPVRWDRKDWLVFSVATATVAATGFLDKPVRRQVLHIQNSAASDVASQIRQFGETYSFATLGLFLVGGEAFQNPTAKAVFIDGAAATLVASGIITPALKWSVGRYRPPAEKGNVDFKPFSGNASFPSGETTQAFAVASVIASHYDELWVKASSYGIATLVGLARLYKDAHWTSDVLAGALIGTTVGTAIVHVNDKRRTNKGKETTFFIAPLLARNAGGVTINLIR